MSPSETVRALLDELGVKWIDTGDGSTLIPAQDATGVAWDVNVWPSGKDMGDCLWVQNRHPLTPEQAVTATVGRSCASCPQMDDPDSYISHLHAALKWHDEHVPRPTNPRGTCVVFEGKKPPEEVLFIRDEGGVTHYLPEVSE